MGQSGVTKRIYLSSYVGARRRADVGIRAPAQKGARTAELRLLPSASGQGLMPPRWRVELAGHVRTWLERAADHVLDRLQPPDAGLTYEGSGHDRDRPQDLAARMREAWVLRDVRSAKRHQTNPPPRRAWPTACAQGRRRSTMAKSPPDGRRSGRAGR